MTVDAHAYLAAGAGGAQYGARYDGWFGAQDAGRAATVNSNFTAIRDAFETKPLKIDCGCNENYFAYVYPAQPYTIYVCKAFWTAPLTGTDSRGGTLLHELSHFDVVAATDDHVYGQQGAAELARTDPARAVRNADSHEYFGENSPPQQ
jgi:peptidyl-Lys metalloendopeptidase